MGAVQGIIRVVTWFANNAARLASLMNSIFSSISAIAAGNIGGAANFIEQSLATALPTVISFMADLLGLGGISKKVQGIIEKVQAPIKKAIDWVVQKAVAMGKKLWAMIKNVGKGKGEDAKDGSTTDPRTRDEKQADLDLAIAESEHIAEQKDITKEQIEDKLANIKQKYDLTELRLINLETGVFYIHGRVNPEKDSKKFETNRETRYIKNGNLKESYRGKKKIRARFYGSNKGYSVEANKKRDELVESFTDPLNKSNWIEPSTGNSLPKSDVTIEHDPSVCWHWNNIGYNSDQSTRRDWFTFKGRLGEMKVMGRTKNSSGGSDAGEYRDDVGPDFRGPDE